MKLYFKEHRWLPWILIIPQLFVIALFFYWPAVQAMIQSFQLEDIFSLNREWVGFENFITLFENPIYREAIYTTLYFSFWGTFLGLTIALLLALFMQKVTKGVYLYRTMLILPYAVSPHSGGGSLDLHVCPRLWAHHLSTEQNRDHMEPSAQCQSSNVACDYGLYLEADLL